MPISPKHVQVSPSAALRKLCEVSNENEPTEQVKQEVIQELVETWEFGRAVNVNYTLDKAAVAGAAVNEKAVVEYLQARAQALCDMGLLDEQGMHAILQGRLQKRDSAYEDIENAVNAHWPPRRRKTENKEMKENDIQQSTMDDITNKMTLPNSYKERRATIMALGDAFSQAYNSIIYQGTRSSIEKQVPTSHLKTKENRNVQVSDQDNHTVKQSDHSSTNGSKLDNLSCQEASFLSSQKPNDGSRPSHRRIADSHQCCVLQ